MQFNEAQAFYCTTAQSVVTESYHKYPGGNHNWPITSLSLGGMPVERLHIQSSVCRFFPLITYTKRLIWGHRFKLWALPKQQSFSADIYIYNHLHDKEASASLKPAGGKQSKSLSNDSPFATQREGFRRHFQGSQAEAWACQCRSQTLNCKAYALMLSITPCSN